MGRVPIPGKTKADEKAETLDGPAATFSSTWAYNIVVNVPD
jgi:hypothetical protein